MKRPLDALPEGLERLNLTPEQEAVILGVIDQRGGQSPTELMVQALKVGRSHVMRWLDELVDRGTLRRFSVSNRAVYERAGVTVDQRFVVEEHKETIRAWLLGRRELPGAIARGTGLPQDEVAETCKAMMVDGDLVGTAVGAAWIFALNIRHTERIDPEAAARVSLSPEAQFRESLRLASKRPEPTLAVRPPRAPAVPTASRAPREPRPTPAPRVTAEPRVSSFERRQKDWAARGLIGLSEAAACLHIPPGEFQRWIDEHPEVADLVSSERPPAVHQDVLGRYRAAHTPAGATWAERAPTGWVSSRTATDLCGREAAELLQCVAAGDVRAVKTDAALLFDPASLLPAEIVPVPVEVVARFLKRDEAQLRRLIRAGRIPHVPSLRKRGSPRVTVQAVREYRAAPALRPPPHAAQQARTRQPTSTEPRAKKPRVAAVIPGHQTTTAAAEAWGFSATALRNWGLT